MIDLHTVYIFYSISLPFHIAVGKYNERTSPWFAHHPIISFKDSLRRQPAIKETGQFFAMRERYASEVINFCHEL
ncbi:Uncharacterized protein BM_BM14162 [Brugia malayi]|uniref:Bm14162 n=1 Tax=Brugia malayi TaxID=6279 RepID=A0A0J9XRP2_BRUMA|nr:Uncharacterized protein BM_BM14162 [Brugia malayi]CDP93530.1 Bm14162 [Brugia malayi]VIO88634.1 Uncharacterized protein BM_BM14162 [Brugia malayi]